MYIISGLFSDLLTSALEGTRRIKVAIQESVIGGNEAVTTQSFSELNSKNGSQYEVEIPFPAIVNLTPVYYGFETGSNPVILKQRDIYGAFVNAKYEVFTDATYTGGDVVNAFNNNDLVINPTGVNIVTNPTVTVEGDQFGAVTSLLGSEGVGHRSLTSFGSQTGEKILKPNTKYLVKITNLDVLAIGILAVRLYYYEGLLSS